MALARKQSTLYVMHARLNMNEVNVAAIQSPSYGIRGCVRVSFHPRPPMRRKNVVELVHIDVCQVDAKSHAGAQYFVTFIDYYSQKLWASQ